MTDTTYTSTLSDNEPISLENLGIDEVAYMYPVKTTDGMGIGIYAANGEQYGVADTMASAQGFIWDNDLKVVPLH